MKASYLIANEIAVASKPFSEGEFVKTCMLKAAEIVRPENANISLTRNTVAERISDLSADLDSQLKRKVK